MGDPRSTALLQSWRSCSPVSSSPPHRPSPLPTLRLSRTMSYSAVAEGSEGTLEYRVYCKNNATGERISWWHQIPLRPEAGKNVFNFIAEIPRGTSGKFEIAPSEEPLNPIKQDVKNGKLRHVADVEAGGKKHTGYFCNYGAFPQTWEDPSHTHPDTGCKGDKDPLDVVEIGSRVHARGEVRQVKVLGVSAMIDEGETDWKIICIDVTDPLAEKLNDITDVDEVTKKTVYEWFRDYKIPDGKPANSFAFDGEAKNAEYALKIVEECHEQWKKAHGTKAGL